MDGQPRWKIDEAERSQIATEGSGRGTGGWVFDDSANRERVSAVVDTG